MIVFGCDVVMCCFMFLNVVKMVFWFLLGMVFGKFSMIGVWFVV